MPLQKLHRLAPYHHTAGMTASYQVFTRFLPCITKVLEFAAFKERLESSHTHLLARAETGMDRLRTTLQPPPTPSSAGHLPTASVVCAQVSEAWNALGFKEAACTSGTACTLHAPHGEEGKAMGTPPAVGYMLPVPRLQQMRFDEDLSTRPVWYPPLPAPVPLAPVRWWESRAQGEVQGSGLGWLAVTAAAESPHTQVG